MSGFLRQVFSESDDRGSFGRLAFGFVLVCTMTFIGYQIYTKAALSLEAWAWFISAVGSTTYLGNKFATLKWGGDKSVENKPQ